MNVGFIGLGYVGLTLAIAASDNGIVSYGVEINEHIKECLKENRAHFFEPGLDDLIAKYNNKSFFCVDEFPADVAFDAFVITVGTPLKKGTDQPNFEYIKSALQSIKNIYDGTQLIILRSTVSVGTTRNIVIPFLAELSGKSEGELLVSMCPERTVEGKAIEELTSLPQVVGGLNAKSVEIARKVFGQITRDIVVVDSLEEAELVKLYCNVYRDMTFALGNVLCVAAQEFGADGTKIIKAANYGYQRSNIALPGFVAGPCLEKDAYILTNNMPDCDSKNFILSARHFNESLEDMVVQWVVRNIGEGSSDKVIAISGMAFKGVPETSDLRGSSSVYIAKKLFDKGYTLRLHDYVAIRSEMEDLKMGDVFDCVEDACKNADLLLVLNNNKKYKELALDAAALKDNFAILDTWDVCGSMSDSGIAKSTLGNLMIKGRLI